MNNSFYEDAQRLRRKYDTDNPFEVLKSMNAVVIFSQAYPKNGLKGYCAIMNRIQYVVINGKLSRIEQRVVGAHELGHLIRHKSDLKPGAAFRDSDIYYATGRKEREANLLAAEFLISDEDVLDLMHGSGSNFYTVASELYVPAPFFAFKLYSMVARGFAMKMPVELDSAFLAKQ